MVFFAARGLIGPSYTALSDLEEGALVKLKESGSPVEFYVAKHDYESELNGSGRTLLVRKDCYDNRQWNSVNENAYGGSSIDIWLNNGYMDLLDPKVKDEIATTKISYTIGNGSSALGNLNRFAFLLSLTELGKSHPDANIEGSVLPIANMLQAVNLNGLASSQFTRSPNKADISGAFRLNADGGFNGGSCTDYRGSRPCFTLPSTILANADGLIE